VGFSGLWDYYHHSMCQAADVTMYLKVHHAWEPGVGLSKPQCGYTHACNAPAVAPALLKGSIRWDTAVPKVLSGSTCPVK
jgi:hypothetical protein